MKQTQCIIYARTANYQDSECRDLGILGQLTKCREYAQQQGWKVIAEYCDHGVSGNTRKRKALQDALTFLRTHRGAKFLVYSVDRLARETGLMLELADEIKANWGTVVTPHGALDQFAAQFMAFVAQMERAAFAERVRRGKRISRERSAKGEQ